MFKITAQIGQALESYKFVTLDVPDLTPESVKAALDAYKDSGSLYDDMKDDLEGSSSAYVTDIVHGEFLDTYSGGEPITVPEGWLRCDELAQWVGADAPPQAALALIDEMKKLLAEAITSHIYDESNGDEIEIDCPYTAAVERANAFLAAFPVVDSFTPPPIGAVEIIKGLIGAVGELDHNIGQMEGLFSDDDGTIAQAREDGDDAVEQANAYLKAVTSDPLTFVVTLSGGMVQDVEVTRSVAGARCVVVDYDVEHGEAETEVDMGDGQWAPAVVSTYESDDTAVTPAPVTRSVEAGEELS